MEGFLSFQIPMSSSNIQSFLKIQGSSPSIQVFKKIKKKFQLVAP